MGRLPRAVEAQEIHLVASRNPKKGRHRLAPPTREVEQFAQKPVGAFGSKKKRSNGLSVAVSILVVPGLFGTVALPAYALGPLEPVETEGAAIMNLKEDFAQSISVDPFA